MLSNVAKTMSSASVPATTSVSETIAPSLTLARPIHKNAVLPANGGGLRHDWTRTEAKALYDLPFMDLLFKAQTVHRASFDPNAVQMSRLLSIKTGGCAEDCGYCNQSASHATGLKASKLMDVERVIGEARKAKETGATRYCMGAAWRSPKERDIDALVAMVEGVRDLGMETCMTLGMLSDEDVARLAKAGLDYYNHNVDTSENYYGKVITTRTYADRLDTLARVRDAGIKVCSGGIVGMGESGEDRVDMLVTLANLAEHPESVPINMLIPIPGTPMANVEKIDPIDFVRTIAVGRIMMPKSHVRLSAGRTDMSDEMQALCFFAGANSIFAGETLLTADNPGEDADAKLFTKLGLHPMDLLVTPPMSETVETEVEVMPLAEAEPIADIEAQLAAVALEPDALKPEQPRTALHELEQLRNRGAFAPVAPPPLPMLPPMSPPMSPAPDRRAIAQYDALKP